MSDGPGYVDDQLIDISHYDLPTFDPACFYRRGVRRAIIGCYSRNATVQMIVGCRAAGIQVVGLYGLVYFGDSSYYVNRDIDTAIDIALQYDIDTVWVDAEMDASEIGVAVPRSYPGQRIEQLQGRLNKVFTFGLRAGIYTAAWWWPSHMAMSTAFKGYPLWHAAYVPSPRLAPGFGGWASCEIHQYTSTRELCGRGRDHNYLFVDSTTGQVEEEPMTPAERKEMDELFRRTGGKTERANNADLLAYADGLNTAILKTVEVMAANGTPEDIDAILKEIAERISPPQIGEPA